MNLNIKN